MGLLPCLGQIFWILTLLVCYFKNHWRQRLSVNYKNVNHVEIYLPCNFEEDLKTSVGVIALVWLNFLHCNIVRLLLQNRLKTEVKYKLQKCFSFCVLVTLQFLKKILGSLVWVIDLFWSNFPNFNIVHLLFQKLLKIELKCKLQTC